MKMVSMRHEEGEGEANALSPISYPQSDYPYGLRLRLEAEQLEQLGLGAHPTAGEAFTLEARATVVRSSTEDPDADGDIDCVCVELQITELGVSKGGGKQEEGKVASRERKGAALYGDDDED